MKHKSLTINKWSKDEIAYLTNMFPNTETKIIAEKLGRKIGLVYQKAYALKLRKSDEYKNTILKDICLKASEKNISSRWPKGHVPINKGKKWDEFVSKESQEKIKQTAFKAGHLPHNTLQDGITTTRISKNNKQYQFIRVSLAKWIPLSHYNWIQANGPIPKGYCVVHKDKNTMNAKLDNLELITKAENCKRNSIMRYPPDLRATMKTLGRLKRTIKSI